MHDPERISRRNRPRPEPRRRRLAWLVGLSLTAALALAATRLGAHEIPRSVVAVAFVRPEPGRVRLLVRVPLEAIRDIDFPERRPGAMDLVRAQALLPGAAQTWIADDLELRAEGDRLPTARITAIRLATPTDRSFASWGEADAHLAAPPLPDTTELPWRRAWLDVALEAPVTAVAARLSIRPAFARLGIRTTTVLHIIDAEGVDHTLLYEGDAGAIRLDPGFVDVIASFAVRGARHILDGFDHLLFLFALVIPFRRVRPLIGIVTAFTVAHSLTLAASAAGVAPDASWFPPMVEWLIALSIVVMALANVVGVAGERRWIAAFGFGLVHGFGFSFALRESLQFSGGHLVSALFGFNVGVEIGQLAVLAVTVPLLNLALARVPSERVAAAVLSALVAHSAWHWMTDRWDALRRYPVELSALADGGVPSLVRAALVIGIGGLALWGLSRLATWLAPPPVTAA